MTDVDRHQLLANLIDETQISLIKAKRQLLATPDPEERARFNQTIEENNLRLKEALVERAEQGLMPAPVEEKSLVRQAWNISQPRNQHFTGRQTLLEQLRLFLIEEHNAVLTPATGNQSGIGKSQLALEYVYRFEGHYQLIWWVRAAELLTLESDFAALANVLNLPEQAAIEQEVAVEAVRRWLEQNDDWLLVFDDVPQPADLTLYFPITGKGHILLISDFVDWDSTVPRLEVGPFTREESVEFLLKRTSQNDEQSAGELAKLLEDLPLGLEQAGAYIKTTGRSLAMYLSFVRDRVFRRRQANKIPGAAAYPFPVEVTWELAYEQIRLISPGGLALLNLCAFMAPENISLILIVEKAAQLPETLADTLTDDLKLNSALSSLERFGLATFNEGVLSIHSLLQTVIRGNLNERDLLYWTGTAVSLLNQLFPYSIKKPETWPGCIQLLPHALAVAGHAEGLGMALDATGRLLNQLGLYVEERAELEQARNLFERAVTAGVTSYGPNHTVVAIRLNNLGNVLHELGELEGAKAVYERALVIDETAYGPNNPNVAIRLNNLGNVLQDLEEMEKARLAYERALAIDEKRYGPSHPKVAIRLNNLGDVMRELGNLPEAKEMLLRALAIDETGYGPNHPNVAMRLNNLGNVLQDLEEWAEAKNTYERALAIDEANFGSTHPTVAFRLYNLGILLGKMENLPEANAVFERSLKIFQQALGDDHPNTTVVRQNLELIREKLSEETETGSE